MRKLSDSLARCEEIGRCKPLGAGRTLAEQVADALTYLSDTGAMLRERRLFTMADRVEIGANSLIDAMKRRGLSCSCKMLDQHTMRYSCTCLDTDTRRRAQRKR